MPCRFESIDHLGVILELFEGSFDVDDMIAMKRAELEAGLEGAHLRNLVDVRGSDPRLSQADLARFARWQREENPGQAGIRVAILAEAPRATALSALYGEKVREKRQVGVFSTLEAALRFLALSGQELGPWLPRLRRGP